MENKNEERSIVDLVVNLMIPVGLVSATGLLIVLAKDPTQIQLDNVVQNVEYRDVNKDGLADIVVKGTSNANKIFYGTLEGKTTNYLTTEQIKAKSEKQLYSKLEQEMKKYGGK